MSKKLLVSRLGAGSITIALCAALPGCNLVLLPDGDCVGQPSSRGRSIAVCAHGDADTDSAGDATLDATGDAVSDATKDQGSGDHP